MTIKEAIVEFRDFSPVTGLRSAWGTTAFCVALAAHITERCGPFFDDVWRAASEAANTPEPCDMRITRDANGHGSVAVKKHSCSAFSTVVMWNPPSTGAVILAAIEAKLKPPEPTKPSIGAKMVERLRKFVDDLEATPKRQPTLAERFEEVAEAATLTKMWSDEVLTGHIEAVRKALTERNS